MASTDTIIVEKTPSLDAPQREHKTEADDGENHGESGGTSDELWKKYLEEIEKQDNEMVERWKGEADSTIIFAGLFSAVVAVSIVESYKWLSPDSGSETVVLLTQISRQLVNISNGIPLESIESSPPFKASGSVLMVNVMWFGSIVLCLAGSVFATLIQESARRYQALTQGCPTLHERARLRTLLLNGIGKFKIDLLHHLLGMSMHVSILLYCVGLLIYIFTIEKLLGFLALIYLLIFYLIYATFTFTPIFFFDSPYGTPFTPLCWRIVHLCLLGMFSTLRGTVDLLPAWSKTESIQSSHRPKWGEALKAKLGGRLTKWRETLKTRVKMHRQWFLGGRQRSVEFYATVAPPAVDENTLEWILAAVVEKDVKELNNFAAWMPEYFDKYTRSDPAKAISEDSSTNPIFGFRLRHLVKKCIPENSGLTEERKRRLQVGLECLWHWVWAYNQNSEHLPSRSYFPDTKLAHRLQTEQDPIAGMIGRCFGALLSKKLVVDLNPCPSPTDSIHVTKDEEACSSSADSEVQTSLTKSGAIDLANIVSLMRSEMNTLVTENVPPEVLKIFQSTVDILAEELTTPVAESGPSPTRKLKLVDSTAASFLAVHSDAQRRLQTSNCQWLLDELNQISERVIRGHRRASTAASGDT